MVEKHKICNMSESASFKVWAIDTHYKACFAMYLIQPTRHLSSFWQKKDYTHVHCLGFPAPGLRKLSWDTPEVLVHEETFEDKTGAMAMAILRGDDGMYHPKQTQDNM